MILSDRKCVDMNMADQLKTKITYFRVYRIGKE